MHSVAEGFGDLLADIFAEADDMAGCTHHHDHDCLFCNFLAQSYLVEDGGQTATILPATERISLLTPAMVSQLRLGVAQLRAPPVA